MSTSMALVPIYIVASVFLAAGLGMIYWSVRRLKVRSVVSGLQAVTTGELAPGLAQVRGRIVADESLETPFSKRACVAFGFRIAKYIRRVGERNRYSEYARGENAVPFLIEDDSGQVVVEPHGAEINWPGERRFRSISGKISLPVKLKLIEPPGGGKGGSIRAKGYRYPEEVPDDLVETTGEPPENRSIYYDDACLAAGDEVTVIGTVSTNDGGKPPYRIAKDKAGPVFLITGEDAPEVQSRLGCSALAGLIVGILLSGVAVTVILVVASFGTIEK